MKKKFLLVKEINQKSHPRMMLILMLMFVMLVPLNGNSSKIVIDFFSPRNSEDMFWSKFTGFMQEAVNDLGMKMNVHYADGNHLKMVEQVKEVIGRGNSSVLVFQNFKKQGSVIVQLAEKAKIPAFVVNAGFEKDEQMGRPREKYRYWIGEVVPDDVEAGYQLARILADQGKKSTDGKIHMVALSGNIADTASIKRVKGLKRAVKHRRDIILEQVFSTDWSSSISREKFCLFKKSRYPLTTVVWAAGDAVALGVAEGSRELDCRIGYDVVTGGIDWSEEGLRAVKEGSLHVSMGGHFMDGAWAAVMIHDYFNGKDFARYGLQVRSKMYPITRRNADAYLQKLKSKNWHRINFKSFSRVYNPRIGKYDFGLSTLLLQL